MIRIDGWFCASSEPSSEPSSETAAYRGVLHSETGSEPSSEPGSETAVRLQVAGAANERRAAVLTILPFSPAGKFYPFHLDNRGMSRTGISVPWFRSRSACLARAHALRLAHDTCTCDDATRMRREHTGKAPYFMCCTHARTRARLPGHWHVCCLPAQRSRD